jgi:site-specific DNA recombinase
VTLVTGIRRVAIYARVSSEDQAERGTIQTQLDELARWTASDPGDEVLPPYIDDGISGTIPLAERPAGGRLMRDARAGRFTELRVYKFDRLGRDAVDLLISGREFEGRSIRLRSLVEGEPGLLAFDIQAAVSDHARRELLRRSADGMNRAAREGRFTGGIVAFGYVVPDRREAAHLVPDTEPLSSTMEMSAADVVRQVYRRLAVDGWTCPRIADELNTLGVPTSYARADRTVKRGERRERTQALWRGGRIRNMVREPKYMGRLEYGRRTKKAREVIPSSIEPLVSEDLWLAGQEMLERNGRVARNTRRHYLLKGVIRCGICGLTFVGSQGRPGATWYRCGGRQRDRGPLSGACPSAYLRGDEIERQVWADIERWLRDPGDLLAELESEHGGETGAAVAEADRITITSAIESLAAQHGRVLALAIRGHLTDADVDRELERIGRDGRDLEARLAAIDAAPTFTSGSDTGALLDDLRARLDAGLTDLQRQEIVRLLVKVTVLADAEAGGAASARAVVEYGFPKPATGVLRTFTGRGSSRPRAGNGPGTFRHGRPGRS